MIEIAGSVEGTEAVQVGLGRAGAAIRSGVRAALMQAGVLIRDSARGTRAFQDRTGKLRQSIGLRLAETDKSLSVVVRPTDKAALFLEAGVVSYGTTNNKRTRVGRRIDKADKARRVKMRSALAAQSGWRIRPRPFMQPAAAAVMPRAREMIEAAVEAALSDQG